MKQNVEFGKSSWKNELVVRMGFVFLEEFQMDVWAISLLWHLPLLFFWGVSNISFDNYVTITWIHFSSLKFLWETVIPKHEFRIRYRNPRNFQPSFFFPISSQHQLNYKRWFSFWLPRCRVSDLTTEAFAAFDLWNSDPIGSCSIGSTDFLPYVLPGSQITSRNEPQPPMAFYCLF